MRLSYYVHLGYGKKLSPPMGSNRGPSDCESSTLPLDQCSVVMVVSFVVVVGVAVAVVVVIMFIDIV